MDGLTLNRLWIRPELVDYRSFPRRTNSTLPPRTEQRRVQGSGNFQGFQENTTFSRQFKEKHNFDFLAGTSFRTNQFRQVGGTTSNIPLGPIQPSPVFGCRTRHA